MDLLKSGIKMIGKEELKTIRTLFYILIVLLILMCLVSRCAINPLSSDNLEIHKKAFQGELLPDSTGGE
jgi:hypothetical protein